jgi:hypothetical protein
VEAVDKLQELGFNSLIDPDRHYPNEVLKRLHFVAAVADAADTEGWLQKLPANILHAGDVARFKRRLQGPGVVERWKQEWNATIMKFPLTLESGMKAATDNGAAVDVYELFP